MAVSDLNGGCHGGPFVPDRQPKRWGREEGGVGVGQGGWDWEAMEGENHKKTTCLQFLKYILLKAKIAELGT